MNIPFLIIVSRAFIVNKSTFIVRDVLMADSFNLHYDVSALKITTFDTIGCQDSDTPDFPNCSFTLVMRFPLERQKSFTVSAECSKHAHHPSFHTAPLAFRAVSRLRLLL